MPHCWAVRIYLSTFHQMHNFTAICNKNAPIKVARLKKRSNPWVTPDVVKLMYERDHVHAKAMKTKDDSLNNHYRSLRNHVTKVIQENKLKYYKEINSLCVSDPKKMWSELKRLVSSKRTPNVINSDISPDRFNRHFVNITNNQNRNVINEPYDFLWKGPKSIYVFKCKHISHMDIESYFNSWANNGGNDILDMDIKLIKIASPIISKSFAPVVNLSLDNGIVHGDWKKGKGNTGKKRERGGLTMKITSYLH